MNTFFAFVASALAASAAPVATAKDAAPAYAVSAHWNIGGAGGWDYLSFDEAGQRLFVTRGDRVVVLDATSGKPIGDVAPLNGVHGVALAPSLGKGYASNGKGDSVTVFDLKTLATTATIAIAGHNPDAIAFDPATSRVFTFNGKSHDATVIDAKTDKPAATIVLSGKPEFAVSDGKGRLYVNIEDRGELVAIDTKRATVVATWTLPDCEEPSGLALDIEHSRAFSVCGNGHMMVTDVKNGHHVATVAIGDDPDAVAFDAQRHLVFSPNGADGTLTVVRQQSPDKYDVVATLPTQRSARTLALDPASHRLFLAAAEFEPLPEPHAEHQRAPMKPDSFAVLVVAPTATP